MEKYGQTPIMTKKELKSDDKHHIPEHIYRKLQETHGGRVIRIRYREELPQNKRDRRIYTDYKAGKPKTYLMKRYYLCRSSINKIIRTMKRKAHTPKKYLS